MYRSPALAKAANSESDIDDLPLKGSAAHSQIEPQKRITGRFPGLLFLPTAPGSGAAFFCRTALRYSTALASLKSAVSKRWVNQF